MVIPPRFQTTATDLVSVCEDLAGGDIANQSESLLCLKVEEIDSYWRAFKNAFEAARDGADGDAEDSARLQTAFRECRNTYLSTKAHLQEIVKQMTIAPMPMSSTHAPHHIDFHERDNFIKVPPCDTEIFAGGYNEWPGFRDMFTAVYANHPHLPPVQKLFHLRSKTTGAAGAIVRSYPLCAENFLYAWEALKARYENKRILVDNQLKILFDMPAVQEETSEGILRIQTTVNDCIAMMRSQGVKDLWDAMLVHFCSRRLPAKTIAHWEQSLPSHRELPTWKQMDIFLTQRYEVVERLASFKEIQSPPAVANLNELAANVFHAEGQYKHSCLLCSGNHPLRQCHNFLGMSVDDRVQFITQRNRCLNCLAGNHMKAKCPSTFRCAKCKKQHHTLLHFPTAAPQNIPVPSFQSNQASGPSTTSHSVQASAQQTKMVTTVVADNGTPTNTHAHVATSQHQVLLPTALAHILHQGERFLVRALLDQGSQRTFITEKFQLQLKLPATATVCNISGMGGQQTQTAKRECTFTLASPRSDFAEEVSAIVLPKLTNWLPSAKITNVNLTEVGALDLADPNFLSPNRIDMIIGSDLLPKIIQTGMRINISGSLLAQNSVFGWYLSGPIPETIHTFTTTVSDGDSNEQLHELLKSFWTQEDVPNQPPARPEDIYCEELYAQTTCRNETGRYVVRLPFKSEFAKSALRLGASRFGALTQYTSLEKRLARQPLMRDTYNSVLLEYLKCDHMEPCSTAEISKDNHFFSFYLPHHAVMKPESTTTKVRVVFNASQKTASTLSLNDVLHTGPVLQMDLVILLLNWRTYRFVFNGDIEKMYRQILVHSDDRAFQRIVFRETTDAPILDYELKTVTFGVNCAPFLAIRTLHQLANDTAHDAPRAALTLRRETYVDDVLAGGHSLEDACNAKAELIRILSSAGFPLRKITANHPKLLEDVAPAHLLDAEFLKFKSASDAKMLGIRWNAITDCFSYRLKAQSAAASATKRQILSDIAKLFDPAGWLTPIIIRAKVLMQQLWLEGTAWDERVTDEALARWHAFVADLPFIEHIQIPRWLQYEPDATIQLHGFCDASERAYCAALYLRVDYHGCAHAHLLTAKSKVAPLQTVSLPRLELCAAVLLSKLVKNINSQFRVHEHETFLWTDSSIVIAWLKRPANAWKTYVANRISQIVTNTGNLSWRHVRSKDNPADLGTRGALAQDLHGNRLWWRGPPWLREAAEKWPQIEAPTTKPLEERKTAVFTITIEAEDPLTRFSSYDRALRVIGYVMRFCKQSRRELAPSPTTLALSQDELHLARNRLLLMSQIMYYPLEYQELSEGKSIGKKSELLTLNPMLDEDGLLRVNGRLINADLTPDEKYPIILPAASRFCRLYLEFMHKMLLHAGGQLMYRMVRHHFYVPRLKRKIKSCINRCHICTIHKQRLKTQMMAALPAERSTLSLPFTHTGVDFAGPFDIKSSALRTAPFLKGYVCVFVCFATKAIHLELCSEISTASFRAAFDRFVGRRGLPRRIFSDNGRNFIGAKNHLDAEFAQFLSSAADDLQQKYSIQGFEWHLIPPHAPHMGGLWEAAVKSFKTHFVKVAGPHKFSFEEFSTLLARIEGVLNSRPLTPMSDDPEDLLALTPSHFLRGAPLTAWPEDSHADVPLTTRWEKAKILYHRFAQRWKTEYLLNLHKRDKWKVPQPNLKIGDFVVIMDNQLPPFEWRKGRIVEVHPGDDGLVRIVDVKTQFGIMTRPTSHMTSCPVCPRRHDLEQCGHFRSLTAEKRLLVVLVNKRCLACLEPTHLRKDCWGSRRCRHCNEEHHTLIHQPDPVYPPHTGGPWRPHVMPSPGSIPHEPRGRSRRRRPRRHQAHRRPSRRLSAPSTAQRERSLEARRPRHVIIRSPPPTPTRPRRTNRTPTPPPIRPGHLRRPSPPIRRQRSQSAPRQRHRRRRCRTARSTAPLPDPPAIMSPPRSQDRLPSSAADREVVQQAMREVREYLHSRDRKRDRPRLYKCWEDSTGSEEDDFWRK